MNPTHELSPSLSDTIRHRFSATEFSSRQVEVETLHRIFEAARWAPSSYNAQPWRFIVTSPDEPERREALLSTLVPQNAAWARQAPVLILTAAETLAKPNGAPNRFAFHDLGQATAHLLLTVTELGLVAHAMGGYDAEKARELFALPAGVEPGAVIALGYAPVAEAGREASPPKPRQRQPLEIQVHGGRWGTPAPFARAECATR